MVNDKHKYPFTDVIKHLKIEEFYEVEIQLQVYDKKFVLHIKDIRHINLQENRQKIKEIDISNESFKNKTIDEMNFEFY